SLEAEQAVLGSILIDPEKLNDITAYLQHSDFYLDDHQKIYLTMQQMFTVSRNVDAVTLIDEMARAGIYDRDGSAAYLKVLAEVVPSASNVMDYARIVKEKSTLRALITACDDTLDEAYAQGEDVRRIIDRAEQRIYSVADQETVKGFTHIRDVLVGAYEQLQTISNDPEAAKGIPTGFDSVDSYILGLGKGDMCIVGARPGMGKTAFAITVALNVAKATKKTVCIFSLEMSNEQIVQRMLSGEALVDGKKMRTGDLGPNDWKNLSIACASLAELDIYIDDSTGLSATEMKSKLRRKADNLGLVVVDYLGLMQSESKNANRSVEVGEISRNLKIMAKELGVPVIVCAQLNRSTEDSKEKKPTMSNLRESGAIEQDADEILLLYRGDYYGEGNGEDQNKAEVIIAKNRHGAVGIAEVGWYKEYAKFRNIENRYDD
ncbi:MAG: replicative DNA helicase, partial [Clostridia bacterium]|nr:replicative DNA helicase [Clostridia bacterium]